MKLYHGSNNEFEKIDRSKARDRRDFGLGFYTTTFVGQAQEWAGAVFDRFGGSGLYLYEFDCDIPSSLHYKLFDTLDSDWLEMVKINRLNGGINHNYDIVRGPVADDKTMPTITLYVSGLITEIEALRQLEYSKPNDQVSFHTSKALECLQLVKRTKL